MHVCACMLCAYAGVYVVCVYYTCGVCVCAHGVHVHALLCVYACMYATCICMYACEVYVYMTVELTRGFNHKDSHDMENSKQIHSQSFSFRGMRLIQAISPVPSQRPGTLKASCNNY